MMGTVTAPRPRPRPPAPWLLLALGALACGEPRDAKPGATPQLDPPPGDQTSPPVPDSGQLSDSGQPDDPAPDPAYCRSLDPDWSAAYTTELDAELAAVIAAHELQGSPRVYLDEAGRCRARSLPDIHDPVPQLGRALFFSTELSGDGDVACATCHHPSLGGGDALSLSLGPGHPTSALGADRAQDIRDLGALKVGRNAPTTFNIAFWDAALFWDGRVESLEPKPGQNGASTDILAPDDPDEEPLGTASTANLVHAQAHLPVAELHEMGGDWGAGFESPAALREALADRLADDADWRARFRAVCDSPGLPESWSAACEQPTDDALVTYPHIAWALAEYQRSQVFDQSPWAAYVQGDTDAIDDTAKRGALVFFRELHEGGQGCARCHAGDLFSDEAYHAIAAPQIGPGTEGSGADLGRQGVTDDPLDAHRFRTPTLLNVEVTGPYFHAGSVASLAQVIVFYRNIENNVAEYFGVPGQPEVHPRPWCRMSQFASLPDCDELYTARHTHGGDIASILDEDAADITTFEGEVSSELLAFLHSLTDPRVRDAAALAPWIEPDSPLEPTASSSEWPHYCEVMTDRDAELNLRTKGMRWAVKGELVDGLNVSAGAAFSDVFGLNYWEELDPDFFIRTGLPRSPSVLSVLVLELLRPEQRTVLRTAYEALRDTHLHGAVLMERQGIYELMQQRRAGAEVPDERFEERFAALARAEGAAIFAAAAAYRDTMLARPETERTAHMAALTDVENGHLDEIPIEVWDPGSGTVQPSETVAAELADLETAGGPDWETFVARYLTWWTGWDCRFSHTPRMDRGGRRANLFGFLPWSQRYLFDLNNGTTSTGPLLQEMSAELATAEAALGITADFEAALAVSLPAQRAQLEARAELVELVLTLQDLDRPTSGVAAMREPILAATATLKAHKAEQLLAELDYYLALADGLRSTGNTRFDAYIDCIESPEVQAMRGNGGFAALGGGSCLP
jgi:cytochrome c peroxidase